MAMTRPAHDKVNEEVERAMDPSVRGAELVKLAAHPDLAVRVAVAARADAPMASLISLAHEPNARIHAALVDNPGVPRYVLETMSASRVAAVRVRAQERLAVLLAS